MSTYRIALIGDGMTAHWGESCPELLDILRRQYQQSDFRIENHGAYASRAGYALWRVSNPYSHPTALPFPHTTNLRAGLSVFDPHITIVESCAYENRTDGPEGMGEYRDILRRLVEEIRHTTQSKVVFCVTLAPHRERFLENAPLWVNTSRATRQRIADDVKLYLDEARRIAQDEEWALADAAAEMEKRVSMGENPRRFFDQGDSLHPSRYGYEVIAHTINRAIDFHRMIEERIMH